MDSGEVDTSETDHTGEARYDLTSPFVYVRIIDDSFPHYLAWGMTPEQYWDEDPWLARAFRRAHELKREESNLVAWLQGLYIYEALIDVHEIFQPMNDKPKLEPYRDHPFPLDGEEDTKSSKPKEADDDGKSAMERMKAQMFQKMSIINRKFKDKGGGTDNG